MKKVMNVVTVSVIVCSFMYIAWNHYAFRALQREALELQIEYLEFKLGIDNQSG